MVILRWMLLLVGVLALAAPEVLADARESYRQGMDELENGRFAAAAEHFRAAINERGEERSSGTFRRAYLPHFQLGVALAEQGDCPGAMAAWEKSLRQGQVQNETDEYRQLERLRQRCERQRLDAAQLAAEQALARTTKAAQALEDLRRVSELATVWSEESSAEEPSFAAREAALAKRFEQAKASLAAARDAAAVEPWEDAKDLALEVAAGFDALAAAARERLLDLQDATASSLDRLQAMEGRAHTVLRRIADLEPYPEGLGARVEAVQDDLAEILRRKATAGPDDLVRLRRQLAVSVARLEEAAAPPPDSLRLAVEAFLSGDHEVVLERLAKDGGDDGEGDGDDADPRVRAYACLLRAAARHALFIVGGGTVELEQALQTEVAQCAALEDPLYPGRQFFSPRFVSYYRAALDRLRGTEQPLASGEEAGG